MCFPLVVLRAALFPLRSYPLVVVLEVLLPVLLPAARTSDNRDASDAATIRTAASARISLRMAALLPSNDDHGRRED